MECQLSPLSAQLPGSPATQVTFLFLLFQQIKITFIDFKHIQILKNVLFVLPALPASSNSTVSNTLDSVNTTQIISTSTSINSTTDVADNTGVVSQCSTGVMSQGRIDKGFHGSTGEGYQGSS